MSTETAGAVAGTDGHACWTKIGVRGDRSCERLAEHMHCRNCAVYASAAAGLLDRPLPGGYLAENTPHFARPKNTDERRDQSIVIFRLGAEWLALPTEVITEIAPLRVIHSLPHRRDGLVRGLVNVRGELLVCVALAQLLGVESAAAGTVNQSRLLVAQHEGGRVAWPADEVHGVHRFRTSELQEAPAAVARVAAAYTRAVLMWRERAVGCLEEAKLFAVVNRSLA